MAEDWNSIGQEFSNNTDVLIAEVDCTNEKTGAHQLCEKNDVLGFPTLKYGNNLVLDEYEGGRDYKSLASFAKESLGPVCGVNNLDLCDDEMKAKIDTYMKMSESELEKLINEKKEKLRDAKKMLEDGFDGLSREYDEVLGPKESLEERIIDVILEDKEKVKDLLKLSVDELMGLKEKLISEAADAEISEEALLEKLNEKYRELHQEYLLTKTNIKNDGYLLMMSVKSFKESGNEEL